ncbi:carbohydrate sulfotransferase 11-like [Panulirus ornatus]|uniref:carbohydrate sulfotransferase 11-like n=1 Tax=Panulirus ornatus TaxID=150431 RepID=UPI003A83F53F
MTEARRKVMAERREEVQKKCGSLKLQGVLAPNWERVYNNFIWSAKHHLVWCPIFKAASTSWVKHFLLLQGETEPDMGLHKRARQLYRPPNNPRKKKELLEFSRKMMIVRHPLERLLSAYRDKMLRVGGSAGRFQSLQRKIAHSYTDPNSQLDPTRYNHTDDTDEKKHEHPTFTQFLMKVRDDLNKAWQTGGAHHVNMHWRPYWITCAPCHINYDLIARVETLDEDQEFIIRELDLQDVLMNVHAHASSFDLYNRTSEATKIYYGQVPLSLLQDVVRLYQYDFDIYGYSPEPYFSLARQDQG